MADALIGAKPILDRFRLDGRVALVTGGAQGIGRAFAHGLGEAGAAVAICDLNLAQAQNVVDELRAKNIDAMAVEVDVTKADQVNKMVDTVVAKWGKLTIGVNNAGIGQWVAAESMSEAQWDRMMNINLKGVMLCTQAEWRAMSPHKYGKIINTASMSGSIVNKPQDQAAYNASKAAVLHYTRSIAAEWATEGIRANTISPGYTRTQLLDDLIETPVGKETYPQWLSLIPMGRVAEVTDLQGAAVYLASEASDYMTGSDLIIDGGYCVW